MKWAIITISFLLLIGGTAHAYEVRHYERNFAGYEGSGYVTMDVTSSIVFEIHVTSGNEFFCFTPEAIVQDGIQYTVGPFSSDDIYLRWYNFDGCGDIYAGVTATGIMNAFPSSFDVWDSFRIYCGVWASNDYFDVAAEPNPPTTSTTSTSIRTTSSSTSSSSTSSSSTSSSSTSSSSTTSTTALCAVEQVYGEYAEQTELLRDYRDNVLAKTEKGRAFIQLFYSFSPLIAKRMEEDPEFREQVERFLDMTVESIREDPQRRSRNRR